MPQGLIQKEEQGVAIKAKVTNEGLLIPKVVAARALGERSEEVEIFEEPGRLVVVAARKDGNRAAVTPRADDPILGLGRNPVRTGARDGSTDHDRYLYGAGE